MTTLACTNPAHGHDTYEDGEGGTLDAPIPMLCADCGEPCHWDEGVFDYRHDDPDKGCFLISPGLRDATPCAA